MAGCITIFRESSRGTEGSCERRDVVQEWFTWPGLFLFIMIYKLFHSSLSPRPYRVRLGNAMPKITWSVKTKPVEMVHDCISPDILCVMGDDIRDHKTRETDKFKTFNTCLSNHTYN